MTATTDNIEFVQGSVKGATQGMTSADDVWREAFNEALMQWVIARAACRPDDVNVPYWACAEDVVPVALSTAGMLRLWEEHEMLSIGAGVLSPELDLDQCAAFAEKLGSMELFDGMKAPQVRYAKRLLARVLELAGLLDTTTAETEGITP